MDSIVQVKESPSGVQWASFSATKCDSCGRPLWYKCHGNPRTVLVKGQPQLVIMCYYECRTSGCEANGTTTVAWHPELIPRKKYSRSTFARVVYLKWQKKFTVDQILGEVPGLTKASCYEIIRTFRAASRARADERIAEKYPPGTKVCASIDGMEMEKGQPTLYTVREAKSGDLLAGDFLEDSSGAALHGMMAGIETKYGIIFAGFLSDRQKGIVAMHDTYYPDVPHQYCTVHFLGNATKALGKADKSLQKDLRSQVRKLGVLKTIKAQNRAEPPALAIAEQEVLADTRKVVLAVANQKKADLFDLPGVAIYENLAKAQGCMSAFLQDPTFTQSSPKFQVLFKHVGSKLAKILADFYPRYQQVSLGNYYIHPAFAAVTRSDPEHPDHEFKALQARWEMVTGDERVPEVVRELVGKALKFAKSYERGLFQWYKAGMPATNNNQEYNYHVKKGDYRRGSPNMAIGPTLELTSPEEMFVPRDLTEAEIGATLDWVGTPEYRSIRGEMKSRSARRAFQRRCRKSIASVLREIFAKLRGRK